MQFPPLTQSERRSLGRFDTPRPLAQALVDWAVKDAKDVVLEPSCGGGVIVESIISRLTELGNLKPGSQIWACDIDNRALFETSRAISPHKLKLIHGNFLAQNISSFGHKQFDAIVGNPPYIRLHAMDEATRRSARACLAHGEPLGAKASLWAYFPIHAYTMLARGGRMGWIFPETILHAKYGKQLFQWAKTKFERCTAVSLRERCFQTDGADERVVLLLLSGAGMPGNCEVEMIEFSTAIECIATLPTLSAKNSSPLPLLNGHAIPHLVSDDAALASQTMERSNDLKCFGDYADVKIGVVTGDNGFFVLTEKKRVSSKLRKHHFLPIVGKFSKLGTSFTFTDKLNAQTQTPAFERHWLLCPDDRSADNRLYEYLKLYPLKDIKMNQTMAKRSHWQIPVVGKLPDAFLRYMGKHGPRMVLNDSEHNCTNTIHRIYFKKPTTRAIQRAICLSIHSSYSQLSAEFEGRQYGSGVLKFEPSEIKKVLVALNMPLIQTLSRAWPHLCKNATAIGYEDVIAEIDAMIVAHCPDLAKSLPLDTVKDLLNKVRERRHGVYLSTRK